MYMCACMCVCVYTLKSVYSGSKLLLRQVLLKTMEHCLLFLVVIFQAFEKFYCNPSFLNFKLKYILLTKYFRLNTVVCHVK